MSDTFVMEAERSEAARRGFNLLAIDPIRRLIHWGGFAYVFQAATLLCFVGLMVFGLALSAPNGVDAKLYAKSNLVNLLIWGLWWPAMVWTAVLVGRVWCAVCPLELVANFSERLGVRLGVRQFNLAKILRAGWLILFLYIVLQMLVVGAQLHRVPRYTALFMFSLLLLAAIAGLLFKDRAFCRGFCPVGLLLSVYGRGGMLGVRAASQDACARCEGKDCVMQHNRRRLDARSCPSLLNPPKLNGNQDCLVCGQCIKSCRPDNMQLLLRTPFSRLNAREPFASWPTVLFIMAVSGFVTSEVVSGWARAEAAFLWIPEHFSEWLALPDLHGFITGLWFLGLYPLALWAILGGLTIAFGGARRIGVAWRRLALPLAVVVSTAHMAKGLEKAMTWGAFLPAAMLHPDGVSTSLAISSKALAAPAALAPHAAYATVGVVLIILGLVFGLREGKLADAASWPKLRVPLAIVALVYAVCVAGWAFR
ncbi:MAG: 4Fe-4S binding protein [Candidatus Hydrogenedentes bacterium]|nr:4Fe-4S binding protein [Candidatus Hydrogenedentota bacterium]